VKSGTAHEFGTTKDWMLKQYDENDAARTKGRMYWDATEIIQKVVESLDDPPGSAVQALRSTDDESTVVAVEIMKDVEDALTELRNGDEVLHDEETES